MRSRGPISADERHSYDEEEIGARPAASGDERVLGGLRERKREIEKSSWSESPPQSSSDSRSPKGSAGPSCLAGPARSCSILPRASCRCTCRRNAVDALAAHVAAVRRRLHARDQPHCCCRQRRRRPTRLSLLTLCCSLSASCASTFTALPLACCRQAHVSRAHTLRTHMREMVRRQGVAHTQ